MQPGTYQTIADRDSEHGAGPSKRHRGVFVFTLCFEELVGWIAKQIALPSAVLDLGLIGWLFRRLVVEACETPHFTNRCLLEHSSTYTNEVADALVQNEQPPTPPDFPVWLRELIAAHGRSMQEWGELYCAALLRELTAHGHLRRRDGRSCARTVANWLAYDARHPVPHVLRVEAPSDEELAGYTTWRPRHSDHGVSGKREGMLTYHWSYEKEFDEQKAGRGTRFQRHEVAYELFTVTEGEVTIVDAQALPTHAGHKTVVKRGQAVWLCRGFKGRLQWKDGQLEKKYAYFNDAGEQLGGFLNGTGELDDERCDTCKFHCEWESYVRKTRAQEVMRCRMCYLRFGPTCSEGFVRSRHGKPEDVTDAERAAVVALKLTATEPADVVG